MNRKERFALSPFFSASVTSENFAPTRRPSCHRRSFGGNVSPVHLQSLTLSGTSIADEEGDLFLFEDIDALYLYQKESHKPISVHGQVSGRDLPAIARKWSLVHPGLLPHLQQSAVHRPETNHGSTSPSLPRGPSRFPSRNKSADLPAVRSEGASSLEGSHTRTTQGKARDSSLAWSNFTRRTTSGQQMVGKLSVIQVSRALQDTWKILRAVNQSNVHITMLYLGRGSAVPIQNVHHQDELKVYQQICGAENICVYKGHLAHREQFQFVSRRHFGFPFSATIYVNGMVAARISWCCEHKYRAGFQQGKRSCFRLMGVRGGIPCHRCLIAQQYQRDRRKGITLTTRPWRNTEFIYEDDRLEKGMMETSVLVTSKSSLLRSDVGASEPAIIDGSYKILTSMDIPTSLGEKSMASSQPCGVAQQNKKFECGYLLSEALNTNDSSQSLGSDSGDKTCKKNVLMRKVHQGLERINNTVDSGQQINQESSSSDEKHKGKLYENQRRFWKKEILDAGGDSNASNKAHKVKKKTRRKRLRKREARREVERNGASAFPVGEDVRKKMWDRGLKKRGYLEDQDAVTQRGGDDEKYSSTLLGFLKNYAGSPVNNPNSGKGRKTTVQDAERLTNDGIQMYSSTMKTENNLMPEALINKEPVDLKQDDGHKQEDLKGNHIKNTERLCKGSNQQSKHNEAGILLGVKKQIEEEGIPSDISKVGLSVHVREKLVSTHKYAETILSKPELNNTREASGSEDWEDSEDWASGSEDWEDSEDWASGSEDWEDSEDWASGSEDWEDSEDWASGSEDWEDSEDWASGSEDWEGSEDWASGSEDWEGSEDWASGSEDWEDSEDWASGSEDWEGSEDWTSGSEDWEDSEDWASGSEDWEDSEDWASGSEDWEDSEDWASGSEDWEDSEDVKKTPVQGRGQITSGFGQILGNEQTQVQDAVDNNVVSLAERKANEDAASSGSALQQRIKNQSQMKPGSAQSNRSLPETNPLASSDVEGRSSMNGLNSIQEHTRFPVNRTVVLGSSKITGESVSSQKPNVLKDEQNPQEPSEVFKSCRNTKDQGIEDIQILAASNFWSPGDLGCTSDPSWEHQVPTHCNQTTGDSYAGIKLATCRREDAVYGNNQLLDKLESENKGEKAMLADCMQNQWTVDTLRKQVVDVIAMLKVCQSVGELILRNTGLTDDLLEMLVSALANNSQSEVETINLNINNLGWQSAELLVKLLKVKPSIKCLLLHGNNLGDKGICILMNGLIDLFLMENTEETRNEIQGGEQVVIQKKKLQLTELDIGSNQLTNEGLKCVTSLLSLNPPLQYLGLSQNNAIDLTGWRQLFDNLKNCRHISHVLLDENVLCNEGAKYLADVLCVNGSLRKVDLDSNEIEDEGGLALCEALCSNPHRSLRYLSLHGNKLSNGVKNKLNILLTENNQGYVKP